MSVTVKWEFKHLIPMVMKMEGFLFPWNILFLYFMHHGSINFVSDVSLKIP